MPLIPRMSPLASNSQPIGLSLRRVASTMPTPLDITSASGNTKLTHNGSTRRDVDASSVTTTAATAIVSPNSIQGAIRRTRTGRSSPPGDPAATAPALKSTVACCMRFL